MTSSSSRLAALAALWVATLVAERATVADTTAGTPAGGLAPQASVAITLADPSPVIGITGETELRINVVNPPAEGLPLPRVLCSIGQIEDLGREGPATFSARYILPAGRFPQPAIIVAEFNNLVWPLRGMTTVRLRAATTESMHTDPGAQVTLRVGDRDFGPQTAPADGVVRIPIVVPPGIEFATARSVNQYGKATEQVVDLHVPYAQRLLFAAPASMRAGSVAELAVYAVEPSGRPANGASLVLHATNAPVWPLGSRVPGEARFLVRAPTVLREKRVRIEAQLEGQSTTRLATLIELRPGPATSLALEAESSFIAPGNGSTRVSLGAEDAFGNPVDATRADVLVDGKAESVKTSVEGQPIILVPAPAPKQKSVIVEGVLDDAHTVRSIPVGIPARPPASARPFANPSPRYTLTPRLGLLWSLGSAEGATLFVDAMAFRIARLPEVGLGLSVGAVQSCFAAENQYAVTKTQLTTVPVLFHLHYRANAGRTFVGVGAGAGLAVSFGRFETYGTTVVGKSYGTAAEASVETGLHLQRGHLVLGAHYLFLSLARFSSGDTVSGNAGGMAFDVGYRLGF
jgi:hypothetical protein